MDGAHQCAGSRAVIDLHSNIGRVNCSREHTIVAAFTENESPPRCPCGAYLRPDVVWFGELLPGQAVAQAGEAARTCEVFFSIDTSAEAYPAAELPMTARAAVVVLPELLARLDAAG